jgi:uncharacterized membrane protein YoaK (UPF0700 family)
MSSLIGQWLATAPLWFVAVVLFGCMVGSALLGWQLRHRWTNKSLQGPESSSAEGQEGYVVSAVMGLLALLMGFTFSMVIDRYDTRRERVLLEANAISTTYFRSQLLQEPHRTQISRLLVDYTDTRIALASASSPDQQDELLEVSNGQVTDLWAATVAAWPTIRGFDFSSSFLESMNQLTEMDAARQASRRAQVPAQVFMLLFAYQFIAAGVMGYVLIGRRGRQIAAALLALFGLSLLLVVDIDRPVGGGISESQGPMLQLQASLQSRPPQVFDPGPMP